ncbi:MAG: DUF952 domain-containing protein [Gemmataceae bacterium]
MTSNYLYHLVSPARWRADADQPYQADSLAVEGFIHCSRRAQVERIANLFYARAPELVALVIDVNKLTSPVRDEDAGTGELFPHVYGSINRDAVIQVVPLQRDATGQWVLRSE